MKTVVLALLAALFVHALVFAFGGVFFFTDEEQKARAPIRDVELFSEEAESEPEKENVEPEEEAEPEPELAVKDEKPPEIVELVRQESPAPAESPTDSIARLDAMSLSALESALSGGGGADSFGVGGGSLASGGRIGGTGTPGRSGGLDGGPGDAIFDIVDLDQQARPIFQAAPVYPSELRRQKVEGTVYVVFIVDASGRVQNPRVERSPHAGFEKPALEAVRQWRFEPAVRAGEKVSCKLRIPIRFSHQT